MARHSLWLGSSLSILAVVGLLGAWPQESRGESSFSSSPFEVVLFLGEVDSGNTAGRTLRSATIHGDGRVVLALDSERGVEEEREIRLARAEILRLLGIAVRSGLAEAEELEAAAHAANDDRSGRAEALQETILLVAPKRTGETGRPLPSTLRAFDIENLAERSSGEPKLDGVAELRREISALWRRPGAKAADPLEREAVRFELSRASDVEILRIVRPYDVRRVQTTLKLFGDGRFVRVERRGQKGAEGSRTIRLEPREVERLLEIAVEHRLFAFDPTSIRARQLRRWVGRHYSVPPDLGTLEAHLRLKSVETRDERFDDITRLVRWRAPDFFRRFVPERDDEILELRGLVALDREAFAMWEAKNP